MPPTPAIHPLARWSTVSASQPDSHPPRRRARPTAASHDDGASPFSTPHLQARAARTDAVAGKPKVATHPSPSFRTWTADQILVNPAKASNASGSCAVTISAPASPNAPINNRSVAKSLVWIRRQGGPAPWPGPLVLTSQVCATMTSVHVRTRVSRLAATVETAIMAVKTSDADCAPARDGDPLEADRKARNTPKARTHTRSAQLHGVSLSSMEAEGDSTGGHRAKLDWAGIDRPSSRPAKRARLAIPPSAAQPVRRPVARHAARKSDPRMRRMEGAAAKPVTRWVGGVPG